MTKINKRSITKFVTISKIFKICCVMTTIHLPIIAYHRSPLSQKFGVPRQPNLVAVPSQIHLIAPYDVADAFVGIEAYSHLWIMWHFHHNKTQNTFRPQVRPPRLGGNDKTGVFATRSMYRPSGVGLSVVELKSIEMGDNGRNVILHIMGADMIDGTPILDIKPYLPYSDSLNATAPMTAPNLKMVQISDTAHQLFYQLMLNGHLTNDDLMIIKNLIAQDPRVAYRQNEIGIINTMRYKTVDIAFFMNDNSELVIDGASVVA